MSHPLCQLGLSPLSLYKGASFTEPLAHTLPRDLTIATHQGRDAFLLARSHGALRALSRALSYNPYLLSDGRHDLFRAAVFAEVSDLSIILSQI
jgi:hypothetical protein